MIQDDIFREREGNCWFLRNKDALYKDNKFDYPFYLLSQIQNKKPIKNVIELGCADGWRLEKLRKVFTDDCKFHGIDASVKAIEAGCRNYPDLHLRNGLLSSVPYDQTFDIVIVNFVLHWIDRSTLSKSIAEIDRLTKDGGILVLGDFLPDFPQRRFYHHCPEESVYTYKQNYATIFESLGVYKQIASITYDHDRPESPLRSSKSQSRAFCALLEKSLAQFYHECV